MQHKTKIQKNPYAFAYWFVKSLDIASSLETSFHIRGMKDKDLIGNVKENTWYIYVYKIDKTIFD